MCCFFFFWNHKGWKRSPRSLSPTVYLPPTCPLKTLSCSKTCRCFLNTFRDSDSTSSLGSLFSTSPLSEEKFFPKIQPEPPLVQLRATTSHPITCYMREEADSHLTRASFQLVVESYKVSPEPFTLHTKQSQLLHLFLTRLVLQTPHQLFCSSLDMLLMRFQAC